MFELTALLTALFRTVARWFGAAPPLPIAVLVGQSDATPEQQVWVDDEEHCVAMQLHAASATDPWGIGVHRARDEDEFRYPILGFLADNDALMISGPGGLQPAYGGSNAYFLIDFSHEDPPWRH